MDSILAPGAQLGPYEIVRLLDKGGMGEVYAGYEPILQRKVAIKIISPSAIEKPEALDLFLAEGKTLAQLNHPNVVTIYQLGIDKGIHYIAMEYVEGKSLDAYLKGENPDFATKLSIFHKVLLGVQALHDKGIVHRDLKLKNILVQSPTSVKIVDFGIAEFVAQPENVTRRTSNAIIGSVHYMAPEVARGGNATFQSDIWSLGIILYRLVTNKLPFNGKSVEEVLAKILVAPVAIPAVDKVFVTPEIEALILKMCERSPATRLRSVGDAIRELNTQTPDVRPRQTWAPEAVTFAVAAIGIAVAVLLALPGRQRTAENADPRLLSESQPPLPSPTSDPTRITTPPSVATAPSPTAPEVSAPGAAEPAAQRPRQEPPRKSAKRVSALARVTPAARAASSQTLEFSARNPASTERVLANPPRFSWNPVPGAERYLIQISRSPGFSQTLVAQEAHETQFVWSTPEFGTFYWRARALGPNKASGAFSAPSKLRINAPAPVPARRSLDIVRKGAKEQDGPAIEWQPVPMIRRYLVSGRAMSKGKPVTVRAVVNGTAFNVPNWDAGTYSLTVTALDLNRAPASAPSAPVTLKINKIVKLAPSPSLRQPRNNTVVPSQGTMITPIHCSWSHVKSAAKYEFQLSSDKDFNTIRHEALTVDPRYLLTMPLPKGVFYWRVRSLGDGTDPSAWSQAFSFVMD